MATSTGAQAIGVGANAPTWDTTHVGWSFASAPPNNQECQLNVHFQRSWREGTNIHATIHWHLTNDGAAGEDVKWDLLYRWANVGAVYPGWTTVPITINVSAAVTLEHLRNEFAVIAGAGFLTRSIFQARLQRDTADPTDDHPHPVIFTKFSVHHETDAFGSVSHDLKWG